MDVASQRSKRSVHAGTWALLVPSMALALRTIRFANIRSGIRLRSANTASRKPPGAATFKPFD